VHNEESSLKKGEPIRRLIDERRHVFHGTCISRIYATQIIRDRVNNKQCSLSHNPCFSSFRADILFYTLSQVGGKVDPCARERKSGDF